MVETTAVNEKSVEWRSGSAQDAAGLKHERASAGPRERKDPIRANCEKVVRITERALNLSDRKNP